QLQGSPFSVWFRMGCVEQLEPFVGVDSLIWSCFCCSCSFIADHIFWLYVVAPIVVACGLMLCSCGILLLYMPCFAPSLGPIYVCFVASRRCLFWSGIAAVLVVILVWVSLLFGVAVLGLFGVSGASFAVVCGCFWVLCFVFWSFVVSFHLAPPAA
ncbi:hypothetical protein U1Q18_032909, partial [Sarracenia purpurea var. burkii]